MRSELNLTLNKIELKKDMIERLSCSRLHEFNLFFISIENCSSANVILDNVISAIELIRCTKCQIQILGRACAITIDNCQGINVRV